jgi:hypothetical protein
VHVAGWSEQEVRTTLKIRSAVLTRDPLADVYGCAPWEPWPPGLAAERFLAHTPADRLAAASEAVHAVGWSPDEVRRTLKIRVRPLADDPLQPLYGGTPWEPWPPGLAADRFLTELLRLKKCTA